MTKGVVIKLFKFIILSLLIIVVFLYYMLYTEGGHQRLSTYASNHISNKMGEKIDLKIKKMSLNPSHLDITALINDSLRVELEGFLSLGGRYDIAYHLFGDTINFRGRRLSDNVDVVGKIKGTFDDFTFKAQGDALEGKVDLSLHHKAERDEDILLHLKDISSEKAQILLGQEALIAGKFSLDADVALFSYLEKKGKVTLDLAKSGIYLQRVKSTYGVLFPDDFMLSSKLTLLFGSGKDTFDGWVDTTAGKIILQKGVILNNNHQLNVLYHLDIQDLSKWAFLTKKRYSGSFVADGEIEYQNALRFDGVTHSLGGVIDYYYEKNVLEAKLQSVLLENLFRAMTYPPIMTGHVNGNANYSLKDKIAIINIKSEDARFQNSSAVRKIYNASGVDLSREHFTQTFFASSVDQGIVSYDFSAKNQHSYITLFNTKMNAHKNTITSDFDLKMQDQELSGKIYGSLKHPKVKLDIGKYLEYKATKEIDAFFGTGTTDDVKRKVKKQLKDVDLQEVKGLIKGFF